VKQLYVCVHWLMWGARLCSNCTGMGCYQPYTWDPEQKVSK